MMDEDYIFLKKVTKADGAFVTNDMANVMRWDVDPILKYRFLWLGSAVKGMYEAHGSQKRMAQLRKTHK